MTEKSKAIKELYKVYEKDGYEAVEDLFDKKYAHLGKWVDCVACEQMKPHIDSTCCVCGTKKRD